MSVSTILTTFNRWRISVNGWLNMWKFYSRGQESYYWYHQINVFTLTLVLLKALRHNETKLSIKRFNPAFYEWQTMDPTFENATSSSERFVFAVINPAAFVLFVFFSLDRHFDYLVLIWCCFLQIYMIRQIWNLLLFVNLKHIQSKFAALILVLRIRLPIAYQIITCS